MTKWALGTFLSLVASYVALIFPSFFFFGLCRLWLRTMELDATSSSICFFFFFQTLAISSYLIIKDRNMQESALSWSVTITWEHAFITRYAQRSCLFTSQDHGFAICFKILAYWLLVSKLCLGPFSPFFMNIM